MTYRLMSVKKFCTQSGKPFDSLPSPKLTRFFGSALEMMRKYSIFDQHKVFIDRVKQLGKIFYDKIFAFDYVALADPAMVAALYRSEGKYPKRLQLPIWIYPRTVRGIPLSVLMAEGEDWHRMRRAVDKQLLTLSSVYRYIEPMNGIAEDFIKQLLHNSQKPSYLKELTYRWSTESVCLFLYDTRIGCLSDEPPADAIKFAKSVETIFETSAVLFSLSLANARIFRPFRFRRHNKAWYTVFDIGKTYMDKKLADIDQKISANQPVDGFLASLLASKTITKQEMFSITVELMAGGVDTTATTLQWFLHLLALNPDKQEKVYNEIAAAGITKHSPISEEYVKNAPYLKACLKESMRLRPIMVGNSRHLPEDSVLGGYCIPKTIPVMTVDLVMANSEEYYRNPGLYTPERWLDKTEEKSSVHRFTSLPFGFGPRSCVGRRLAELELYVLIARIISRYKIISLNKSLAEQKSQLIISPKEPIRIQLERRQ